MQALRILCLLVIAGCPTASNKTPDAGSPGSLLADRCVPGMNWRPGSRIFEERTEAWGFDALKGEYVNMIDAGIIDPAKVTKSALQNAVSVASLLLTTDCLIANKPDPTPAGPPEGMDGMDGMDGMGGMGDFGM